MAKVFPNYEVEARARILRAAVEAFHEHGYRGATMELIASKMGISKGSIFTYYASKSELLREVFKNNDEFLNEKVLLSGTEDLFSRPEQLFDRLRRYSDVSGPGLYYEILVQSSQDPVLKKIVHESTIRTASMIEDIIEDLKAQKKVGEMVDSKALALGMVSLYDGMMARIALGYDETEVRKAWVIMLRSIANGALYIPEGKKDNVGKKQG